MLHFTISKFSGVLVGPRYCSNRFAAKKPIEAKSEFRCDQLRYYRKKRCRDILIEVRLARDCMALDQGLKKILLGVVVRIRGSVDKQYEQIE